MSQKMEKITNQKVILRISQKKKMRLNKILRRVMKEKGKKEKITKGTRKNKKNQIIMITVCQIPKNKRNLKALEKLAQHLYAHLVTGEMLFHLKQKATLLSKRKS